MEITQFTYFQQVGGFETKPVPAEITYGLERIAMYVQGVDNVYDLEWAHGVSYGEIYKVAETEYSRYAFEEADVDHLKADFDANESQAARLLKAGLIQPGYDHVLKCSHSFNLMDARGAFSASQRAAYMAKVRGLARLAATTWLKKRENLGYPLLGTEGR